MVQLGDSQTVFLPDARGQTGQTRQMVVGEDAQLTRKALPGGLHMHGACHGGPEPTLGPHGQPIVFVVGQRAVLVTLGIRQRRQHEPVFLGRSMAIGHWIKQLGHDASVPCREHNFKTEVASTLCGIASNTAPRAMSESRSQTAAKSPCGCPRYRGARRR